MKKMLHYPNDQPFGVTLYEYREEPPFERYVGFGPLLSIQRYRTVKEVIEKLAEQTTVSTVAEFGSNTFNFFLSHLLDCSFLDVVHQIDIDEDQIHSGLYSISMEIERKFRVRKGEKPLFVNVFQGNIAEKDDRLLNSDVVVGIELIEHLEQADFENFPQNIFGFIEPKMVVLTTPNRDFNVLFEFEEGKIFRHADHKFEFTRQEFQNWADGIVEKYPQYSVQIYGIGEPPEDCQLDVGFCSQMAIFTRSSLPKLSNELTQGFRAYELIGTYNYFNFKPLFSLCSGEEADKCEVTERRKRRKRRGKKKVRE